MYNQTLAASTSKSLVFVDPEVANADELIKGVAPGAEVIVLDATRDGVAQLTEAIAQHNDVSTIHIVSHGEAGSLQLGSTQLNPQTIDTNYAASLRSWAKALTPDADILLYGCDVAAGATGAAFVQQLSQLTGADVAASNNLTGNASQGGDWDLEVASGKIEATSAFQTDLMQAYSGVFAIPTAPTNNLDVSSATYMGGASDDFANAVDISPTGGVVVLGGQMPGHNPGNLTPRNLLGGGSGVVVRYNNTTNRPLSVTRLPNSIKDLEINSSNGQIAVAGDFGVAVLSADASSVVWSANPGAVSRVAMDSNGTVAAMRDISGGSDQILVYNNSGSRIGNWSTGKSSRHFNDVAITSQNGGTVIATGYEQKASDLQVAFNTAWSYGGTRKWNAYDFSASTAKGAGLAGDTRGERVAIGRDGQLYVASKVNGGTGASIFSRDPLNFSVSARPETVANDSYNTPTNVGSVNMTWYGRYNLANGDLIKGQSLLTRLSSGKGNSLTRNSITADERGNVYLAGDAAYAIANRNNQQIAGKAVSPYAGDGHILIVSSDLSKRYVWTPFPGGSGKAFNVRNGVAAAALTVNSTNPQVTHNALQTRPGGGKDAYLAVLGGGTGTATTSSLRLSTNNEGSDILTAGTDNNTLFGQDGNDSLNGVKAAVNTGKGEVDVLNGGRDADRYILGDAAKVYYDEGLLSSSGQSDRAVIADFNNIQDKLLLHGSGGNYPLGNSSTDTGLYSAAGQSTKELIDTSQASNPLNVRDSNLAYV